MTSLMQRRFVPYALMCRLGGCFFISSFRKPLENAKVTWWSLYTVYSAIVVGFYCGFEVTIIVQKAHVFRDFSHAFSPSLLLIVRTMMVSKALLNAITVVKGSEELLKFFRNSSTFEKTAGFSPAKPGLRDLWRQQGSFFRPFLVIIGLVSTYVVSLLPLLVSPSKLFPANVSFLGKLCSSVAMVCSVHCYLLYEAIPYMVLRSCSSVLVQYLRAQLKALERCCQFTSAPAEAQLCQQLEIIRHNVQIVRGLKDSLNAIFQVPLAVSSAVMLLVVCVVCYAMFNDGIYGMEIPLFVSYCAYSGFAFIDMACVSQALADETQKIKNATKTAFTFQATNGYMHQIRYLHETIDPDGMCLSGAGFFRLNKSLLVSMAGTMITYTVIISQTSNDLAHKAESINNLNVTETGASPEED